MPLQSPRLHPQPPMAPSRLMTSAECLLLFPLEVPIARALPHQTPTKQKVPGSSPPTCGLTCALCDHPLEIPNGPCWLLSTAYSRTEGSCTKPTRPSGLSCGARFLSLGRGIGRRPPSASQHLLHQPCREPSRAQLSWCCTLLGPGSLAILLHLCVRISILQFDPNTALLHRPPSEHLLHQPCRQPSMGQLGWSCTL
jgi:hypothetical protein